MSRIEESVTVMRPEAEVFAYTTLANNWPKWQSIVTEAEQTSQGPVGAGATFGGMSRMMGVSMKWTARVTEYDPGRKWSKTIAIGSMIISEQLIFESMEGGTRFTIVYDISAVGLMKLAAPMIVKSMRKETVKSLGNVKRILEAN